MRNEMPPPAGDNIPFPLIPTLSPLPVLEDDEPTVKMKIPPHLLEQMRQYHRGPNWGLLLALGFCLAFWGSVIYLFWRAHG